MVYNPWVLGVLGIVPCARMGVDTMTVLNVANLRDQDTNRWNKLLVARIFTKEYARDILAFQWPDFSQCRHAGLEGE